VILATNHQSFMDGPLLFGFVNRVVSCLVKAEAFAPLSGKLGRILISGAQIPVLRGEVDAAPVRLALRLLDAGGVLGIFPEGTRGDGRADRSMAGAGYFALRTGAAVVPVAIHGSAHLMHRGGIARPRVRMTFGEPIGFEPSTPPLHRPDWIEAAEQIRTALADLVRTTEFLPEPKVAMISARAKAGT
jgi:1-acyl-sn-glycerol-3-phosphate acyltransferase